MFSYDDALDCFGVHAVGGRARVSDDQASATPGDRLFGLLFDLAFHLRARDLSNCPSDGCADGGRGEQRRSEQNHDKTDATEAYGAFLCQVVGLLDRRVAFEVTADTNGAVDLDAGINH